MKLAVAASLLFCFGGMTAGAASRDHGAALFTEAGCRHCHVIGDAGGHKGPDLSGVGLVLAPKKLRSQVVYGGNEMPAFQGVLSRGEINDLVAFLRTCRVPAKPASPAH